MPNLYCTLPDNEFTCYDIIQEVIASCTIQSVKEKDIRGHIIIHISFFTVEEKQLFLKKITERSLPLSWYDRL